LETKKLSKKSSALGWFFQKSANQTALKGLYIFGSVGRGKSMLMDLFFKTARYEPKKRIHFHDFMADAQERIHLQRLAFKEGKSKEEDPIPPVARALAEEARLLCFDEFSVNDIADAMILGRLFQGLFKEGTVVVATSNVMPDDLYQDGLNRQRFLPFIDLLKAHCDVFELDAKTDYRLEKLSSTPIYLTPLGKKANLAMDALWLSMTGNQQEEQTVLSVQGRKVIVPRSSEGHARLEFADLCEKPLGSKDYLALARQFHTIFLDNVPILNATRKSALKRFINLIDTLYDEKIKLVVSAAAEPMALCTVKTGTEAFEFQRTASRLVEMQSSEYLGQ
jgi:cell division protein ZapE